MFSATCLDGIGNTGTASTTLVGPPEILMLVPTNDYFGNPNTLGFTGTGNLFPGTVAQSAFTVTGSGTTFLKMNIGDTFAPVGGTACIIVNIASNTSMTVSVSQTVSAGAYYNGLTLSYVLGRITQPDRSKRWYILPRGKNGKDERTNSIFESFEDDTKEKTNDGVRRIQIELTGTDDGAIPQLKRQLDPIWEQGADTTVYYWDNNGSLIGAFNTAGQLDGRRINARSFDDVYNPGQFKKAPRLMLEFDLHSDESDSNIMAIKRCALDSTLSPVIGKLKGLMDIVINPYLYSSLSAAGFTLTLNTGYGGLSVNTNISNQNVTPYQATGMGINNFVSALPQPVATLTCTNTGIQVGDIIVGDDSYAVGQVVKLTSNSSVDVAMAFGTFIPTSDAACLTYRNTGGLVGLVAGLNPDVTGVATATYTAPLTGFILDTTLLASAGGGAGNGYIPLASVTAGSLANGRPSGVYAIVFLGPTTQLTNAHGNYPSVTDTIQPNMVNIIGNSFQYYDFTIVNTTPTVL